MGEGLGHDNLLEVLDAFREHTSIHVPSVDIVDIFKAALCFGQWGGDGVLCHIVQNNDSTAGIVGATPAMVLDKLGFVMYVL
jgi:hypothetical protein